jgi:LysM repeat protein
MVLTLYGCGGGQEADATRTPQPSDPFTSPIVTFGDTPTPPAEEGAYPASVYLNPSTLTLGVGETATVEVWAEGAGSFQTLQLELRFAQDVFNVIDTDPQQEGVQIRTGALMEPAEVETNRVTVGVTGRIVYEVRRGSEDSDAANGAVASITVRGLTEGRGALQFEQVTALDAAGADLGLVPLSDGLITVVGEAGSSATTEPSTGDRPTPGPAAQTAAPPSSATGVYYIVQPGENLFRIGLEFGCSADAIATASDIADPGQVSAGTMVLIPTPPPQGTYGYYVQSQDTMYSIASQFGMTVEELATLNNLGTNHTISVGQILVVTP